MMSEERNFWTLSGHAAEGRRHPILLYFRDNPELSGIGCDRLGKNMCA